MKKILLLLILFSLQTVFSQTDEKESLKQLNQKSVENYKNGNFDEALRLAKQSVEISIKVYGDQTLETAVYLTNLGIIQRENRKYRDSIQNLQKALDIYLKLDSGKELQIIETLQVLATSQVLDGKKKEAEQSYLQAISLSEKKFGAENKEIFVLALNLANLYARDKNYKQSDDYYLKSFKLAKIHFGEKSLQVEQTSNSRVCLNDSDDKQQEDWFHSEYDKIFGFNPLNTSDKVINGKAVKLIRPPYPQEAKAQRLTGIVKVRVKIDPSGNVIEANSACGIGILEKAGEEAAKLSKFSPTLLNGTAVEVRGVIIYRFTAR